MKHTLLILSVTLLSSACEKVENSSASSIKWEPPLYPEIEFHINAPMQTVMMNPSPDGWNPNSKSTLSASTDKQSEFHYELSCEYQGTDSKADYYSVTITCPAEGGSTTTTETLQYRGKPIEIHRDEDCLIGVRPGKIRH